MPVPPEPDPRADGLQMLDELASHWHNIARREWKSLLGHLDDFKPASFRWAPAVGPRADAHPDSLSLIHI
eukprot:3651204-Karenia_brevis.AAC.1